MKKVLLVAMAIPLIIFQHQRAEAQKFRELVAVGVFAAGTGQKTAGQVYKLNPDWPTAAQYCISLQPGRCVPCDLDWSKQTCVMRASEPVLDISQSVPPPVPPANTPPAEEPREDAVAAVRMFYAALSEADGTAAAALMVPEKRGRGNFNPAAMTRFFSSLRQPLTVRSIVALDDDTVAVAYDFVGPNGQACDTVATVRTVHSAGMTLIQSISAKC
jgi:hypothetical protein